MKVLFGSRFNAGKYITEYFSSLPSYNLEFVIPDAYDEQSLLKYAPETEILIKESVSKEFLEHAPKLKHLQVPYTGSERIDFNLMTAYPNITISNTHSISLTIAEHAVALLLASAKQVGYRDKRMRQGDWSPRTAPEMYSVPLLGQTVAIIGYGAIGQKAAKMLKHGFDMKILAIKRNPGSMELDGVYDFLGGINYIPKVLKESDFVIVALPLTEETRGIIGAKEFELMKPNSIIVNVARGPLIDEQALYDFLKTRKGYAGIDTWYIYPKGGATGPADPSEKVYQNFPFQELDNIIMSPHSAFKVPDTCVKAAQDIIENLYLLAQDQNPINILYKDLGY